MASNPDIEVRVDIKTRLVSVIEESPGVLSSQRVVFLAVTAANVLAFLVLVGGIAFGSKLDVPGGVIAFASLLQGIATAGKVIQQRNE